MSSSKDASFRANAGLLVLNAEGLVLAVERGDRPGAWQLPQGGIEADETALVAAYRELEEETGLRPAEVTLLAEVPGWLVYELPPEWRRAKTGLGQAQKWFVFRHAPKPKADWKVGPLPAGGENSATAWMPLADLKARVPEFRRAIYAALEVFLAKV